MGNFLCSCLFEYSDLGSVRFPECYYKTAKGAALSSKTEDSVFASSSPSLTLFLIMDFFGSAGLNPLLKKVTSAAYFFSLSFPPHFLHGHFHG